MSGGYGGGWYEPPREPRPGDEKRPQRELFPNVGKTKFPPAKKQGNWDTTDEIPRRIYSGLRHETHDLECFIAWVETDPDWTDKDLKRLDKAVTVMKAGFKIMKKALKARERRPVKSEKVEG